MLVLLVTGPAYVVFWCWSMLFFPAGVAVTQLCHVLNTYKQLFVQLILGPVTALKWLQVTFLIHSDQ